MMTLGGRIRKIRKENQLTQMEFASELRISRPHVTNIENGKEKPSGTLVRLISELFKVDESWINSGRD
ncbi:helix-turn-helix domain-containing protein [uncultured Oscillibacter sp.]|uniref:helix-turn-helix domain-containing protein n=1 Tax=uncultured Oscillibacter sp. TaxID=876091 RepID=UPI002601B55E|nr:helix-turn-helix transcriptional regulator [uncultured Oscillibacter sp.]